MIDAWRTWSRLLLLIVCLWPAQVHAQGSIAARRPVPDFNVMLNDDGDWTFRSADPSVTKAYLEAAVDGLAGTPVKTYVRCVGLGSDVLYYPTQAGDPVGWRDADKQQAYLELARANLQAGVDPIRIVAERTKAVGLQFVPSYRMNDAHFARTPHTHYATGRFWMEHHEQFAMSNNRLDFTFDEVRAYRLGIIFEVIDRYADVMDGLELDFYRHAVFFPTGKGPERAHLLTEMVEQVRARLDEAGEKSGRTLYLFVRVSPTPRHCMTSGMDVAAWMRRGLVDVVIPSTLYDLSYDMPIEQFVALGRETGCKVYPAIYERTPHARHFLRRPREVDYADKATWVPLIEAQRAAAINYRAKGADGFELYNFRTPPGPYGFETHRIYAHPAAVTMLDRVYPITVGTQNDTYEDAKQLPVEVPPSGRVEMKLFVGQAMREPGAVDPDFVALRLGLRGHDAEGRLRVKLNGQVVAEGAMKSLLTPVTGAMHEIETFPAQPEAYWQAQVKDLQAVRQGVNELSLEFESRSGVKIVVVEAQLAVMYPNPYPRRL